MASIESKQQIELPSLPKFRPEFPEVVRVLDRIRSTIAESQKADELFEFYWFAREYPRFYRYHLSHAEYRLRQIHEKYQQVAIETIEQYRHDLTKTNDFEVAISNIQTHIIYWDFETYLSAINNALDILARIVGTAYLSPTPVSFNKLCQKKELTGIVEILRAAKTRWVNRLKDYRDCFVHYTPVDNRVFLQISRIKNIYKVRGALPVNPNIRENLGFRYSNRIELLKYSATVFRHMQSLDHAVARELERLHREGSYPMRTTNLFFVGQRMRE
ncbi:MAG: hypothetical protein ACREBU_17550 [Nitrososphaera sp.]